MFPNKPHNFPGGLETLYTTFCGQRTAKHRQSLATSGLPPLEDHMVCAIFFFPVVEPTSCGCRRNSGENLAHQWDLRTNSVLWPSTPYSYPKGQAALRPFSPVSNAPDCKVAGNGLPSKQEQKHWLLRSLLSAKPKGYLREFVDIFQLVMDSSCERTAK
jgi:hypothetical protein